MSSSVVKTLFFSGALACTSPASPQADAVPGESTRVIQSIGVVRADGTTVVTRATQGPTDAPECNQELLSFPNAKTVTFVVSPQDMNRYTWRIAFFGNGSTGLSHVTPDEHGIIHGDVGAQRIVDAVAQCPPNRAPVSTREEEPEQYYLVATDIDTGDHYYTIDIPQVRLAALLMSLQGSINMTRPDQEDRRTWFRKRMEITNQNNITTRDIFLSLASDMWSLDQVLDGIYVKTGCYADVSNGFIMVDRC